MPFVVQLTDGLSELWGGNESPVRLLDLGAGVKRYFFDPDTRRLAVLYADERAYLISVEWLEAFHSRSDSTPSTRVSELARKYVSRARLRE